MSQKIKFRVWDKNLCHYVAGAEFGLARMSIRPDEDDGCIFSFDTLFPGRYTWEQYTGLSDKNGTPIYEGDIIKDTSDGDCLINAVFWCEKGGFWGVKPRSPFADREWGWFIGREDIEVIGNIHESNMEELRKRNPKPTGNT